MSLNQLIEVKEKMKNDKSILLIFRLFMYIYIILKVVYWYWYCRNLQCRYKVQSIMQESSIPLADALSACCAQTEKWNDSKCCRITNQLIVNQICQTRNSFSRFAELGKLSANHAALVIRAQIQKRIIITIAIVIMFRGQRDYVKAGARTNFYTLTHQLYVYTYIYIYEQFSNKGMILADMRDTVSHSCLSTVSNYCHQTKRFLSINESLALADHFIKHSCAALPHRECLAFDKHYRK